MYLVIFIKRREGVHAFRLIPTKKNQNKARKAKMWKKFSPKNGQQEVLIDEIPKQTKWST